MQGGGWVWGGVMLVSLTMVLAEPRTGNARSAARRATAEATPPTGGEVYRSAIVMEADSGAVLFEKDAHRQNPPASMTKMMLMLIVAERVRDGSLHWDDPITTSAWDFLHRTSRLDVPQESIRIGVPAYDDSDDVTLGKILALPFRRQRNDWSRT